MRQTVPNHLLHLNSDTFQFLQHHCEGITYNVGSSARNIRETLSERNGRWRTAAMVVT